jgi:hypothetical protein
LIRRYRLEFLETASKASIFPKVLQVLQAVAQVLLLALDLAILLPSALATVALEELEGPSKL